jgi:hypothetical protein
VTRTRANPADRIARLARPIHPTATGGEDSKLRPADHESVENDAGHLQKFMNILVRAFTGLL